MRPQIAVFVMAAFAATKCLAQDENSEDVFDKPPAKDVKTPVDLMLDDEMPMAVPKEELMNEGADSFETSTEMIEISPNDTSLEVNPIQKTAVFSPINQLDGGLFNFSKATIEEDSAEDSDELPEKTTVKSTVMVADKAVTKTSERPATQVVTTSTLEVITFSSLPIEVDEVADRRVLKEKELATHTTPVTTTQTTVAVSDPSESVDVGETPFDQSALEGLFEQDGSVIDSSLSTDQTPTFPILKMTEEDSKILTNVPKTIVSSTSKHTTTTEKSSEAPTTETTTITEPSPTTETVAETTTEENVSVTATSTTLSTESINSTESEEEETTTSSEESTTSEDLSTIPALQNSSKVFLPAKSIKTPITFRIVSLDFTQEFSDIQSGPSKKLAKDLVPSIAEFINSISGQSNFVNAEIKSLTKGSVIVRADVLTKKPLGDPQMAVNLLEAAFSRNNSMIAHYQIDTLSVTVDGITSQAYIDSISTQTTSYSLSSLMIVIIAFALVFIIGIALFVIMITTKRRRQSTIKLNMDDTIRSNTPDSDDTPHNVHLMSFGTTPRTSQKPGPIKKITIDETNSPMY